MHPFSSPEPPGKSKIPAVFSWQRLSVLMGAVIVEIGSGTNYGFSGWGPQLGAKLRLSHTQLNIVALAGNLGVASTGPICGRIADARGPVILFASSFFFLLLSYSGIRIFFDTGLAEDVTTLSTFSFAVLVLCGYMTGVGGNGGATGALNSVANTFPDRMRATTAGIVFSGFGLSAFFFSEIAHLAFGGDTSAYLNLLAWGTAACMLVGLLVVRPIPLPGNEIHHASGESGSYALLPAEDILGESRPSMAHTKAKKVDIFGKALWVNKDFWTLFITMTIFCGIGIMYINNVGSIVQVLITDGLGDFDSEISARWQALQVSTISVTNFAGRIFFGLLSDIAKKNKFPRSFCLLAIALTSLASMIITANMDNVEDLWKPSALLGLGYGGMYVLISSLSADYFGLAHFSENWGYLCLSPLVGGNVFSLIFGRNLDSNEPQVQNMTSGVPAHSGCAKGRYCYVDAIYLIMGAWLVGTVLSIWICWRDWRRERTDAKELDG